MKVLIITAPDFGHASIFLKIGSVLADEGHDVTVSSNYKHPSLSFPNNVKFKLSNVMFWFSQKLQGRQFNLVNCWISNSLDDVVSECMRYYADFDIDVAPSSYDILIVDRYLSSILLMYPNLICRAVVVNTTTNPYRGVVRPPLNMYVSVEGATNKFLVRLYWFNNIIRHKIRSCKYGNFYPWAIIKKMSNIPNEVLDELVFGSYYTCINCGIKRVPEFCAGFQSFDVLSTSNVKEIRYLGVNTFSEYIDDKQYRMLVDRIEVARDRNLKIVYLNFGTVLKNNIDYTNMVVQRFIDVLRRRKDLFGVIGGAQAWFDKVDLQGVSNVYVDNFIPQGYVLRNSSVFITHGGLSSVHEAVMSLTPMIGILIKKSYDRPGNISKIVKHGIGSCVRLDEINARRFETEIDNLLDDPNFLRRINLLHRSFQQESSRSESNILNLCTFTNHNI